MDAMSVAGALVFLFLLMLFCQLLRARTTVFDRLYIPTSIIAGTVGLLLGPQILGALTADQGLLANGLFPESTTTVWRSLPGLLISVVFACLFLGKRLPAVGEVWQVSGPQIMLGYTLSFGQYAVGLAAVVLVLTPYFGVDPVVGILIEVALTGGHGTAAGLAPTFEEMGFPEATDMALGLATLGLVAGVVLGTLFINIAVRSPRFNVANNLKPSPNKVAAQPREGNLPVRSNRSIAMDSLTLHLGIVGLAVFIGWLMLQGLILLEAVSWGRVTGPLMVYVPLFPLAMIGGAMVQALAQRMGLTAHIERQQIAHIGGLALDVIIVAALATLSLSAIGEYLLPFTVLAVLGIGWTTLAFWWLAPKIIAEDWFEKALGDYGQASGMAVTGLLLMGVADPQQRTRALEGFGYKQLLFEPMVGGGLITALSPILVMQLGAPTLLVVFTVATAIAALIGMGLRRAAVR